MRQETILITGAAGFIGSALASRLLPLTRGHEVRLVMLYHQARPPFENGADTVVVRGSLNDYNFVSEVISKYEVNTVYHFASNSIVRKCANDPMNAYLTNVMGTVTLLEAIRNAGGNTVRKIIMFTSDKVYGHAPPPYNENTAFLPRYTYESTKACQDIVAQNYFFNYRLPIVIVRSSNVYGPRDPNLTRIIPNAISSIHRGEKPFIFSGVKHYIREFVYIDDVVDALLLINRRAAAGETFCIGGTETISIENLVRKICTLMGFTQGIAIIDKPSNFQEIEEQSIDSSKLKQLGWSPRFTLDQGLRECVRSPFFGARETVLGRSEEQAAAIS